ncbi:OB-fold protein [Jejuia spongiicola]|uniref:tRNA_anti-like n=1 Tax=Jejuia spongiicola TaxID=2942207 RepID=A0ABT0QBS6_9FLAO|nr:MULTISPECIES: hypothetical protein [Flavobacteriaceae]MCL6294432.1 hypothetical protein [Jejuia spongiicola]PIA79382.1 hypothetical protein BFR04_00585 [Gaetbulibacter sp. 4G1]
MASKKSKRNWLILLIFLALSAIIGYQYIYQDHRNIETEKAEFALTSQTISDEFKLDVLKSEKKYLNQTIEISGTITEVNKNDLTLNDIVFCQFNTSVNQSIKVNSAVKIKGRCIGYDDLLEQVKLDQCTFIK